MSEEKISATSRYYGIGQAVYAGEDGSQTVYLKRRFIKGTQGIPIGKHTVSEGDRPDTVAAKTIGDPLQYWRLCDTNAVLHPRDLTWQIGKNITVTYPGAESV
jgi:hypothetical protein